MKRIGLIFLLLFLLAVSGFGQTVAFDSASGCSGDVAASFTWSHACSGENRVLIVSFGGSQSLAGQVSSVTYAGSPMTLVPGSGHTSSSTTLAFQYYMAGPPLGAHTVAITLLSSVVINSATSISVTGSNGMVRGNTSYYVEGNAQFGVGITLGPITTASGDMVVDDLIYSSTNAPTPNPTSGMQTLRVNENFSPYCGVASSTYVASGSSTLLQYSLGATGVWGYSAVSVESGTQQKSSSGLATMGVGR